MKLGSAIAAAGTSIIAPRSNMVGHFVAFGAQLLARSFCMQLARRQQSRRGC